MRHCEWIIRDCELGRQALLKNESVFSVSNGYFGVRGNFEEGYDSPDTIRGAYINGCYDTRDIRYEEKLSGFPEEKQSIVNVHDCQTIILSIEGETFSVFSGGVISFDRTLDMKNGVTTRSVVWESPRGRRVEIEIKRMASFAVRELFIIDYIVTPLNFDGEICFISLDSADVMNYSDGEDPRTNSRKDRNLNFLRGEVSEGRVYLESETVRSGIRVATCSCHTVSKEAGFEYSLDGMCAKTTIKTSAAAGEAVRLLKYVFFIDSNSCDDLKKTAFELAARHTQNVDGLYEKQRAFLEKKWNAACVKIDSSDGAGLSLRYCIYQLICQSAFCGSSIPAKGLSGEGYEGHYFWDMEIFIHPFYTLTDPDTAGKLLLYRYSTLDAARKNAKKLGHKCGAAYPWRTITGDECSAFFPAGAAQYHINADISYAIINYYLATGDEQLLFGEGAEIIFETARLWLDLGHFCGGKFRIDTVTGPDEYTCLADNNYYTNLMARHNLKWAVSIYKRLGPDSAVVRRIGLKGSEIEAFEQAYRNMYLPYDDEKGITPQDDSFLNKKEWDFTAPPENYPLLLHYHPMTLYRHQVCKQADVLLAYSLFLKEHDKELMKRSYDYYERITTHDSSLSACTFSIMAARLGDTEKGYDYFMRTLRTDLDDTHQNTKDGLHMANMGGAYLCVLSGFAGLIIDESGPSLSPVLPENWRSYSFRFRYKGSLFEVMVKREGTSITRIAGEERVIKLNGIEMRC